MSTRGQASIEFVLILLFMLVMTLSIVMPLGQKMQNALDDVQRVGSLSASTSKINQTISLFTSIPGDNRQVLDLYLSPDTNWLCDPVTKKITVTFALNSSVYNSDGFIPSTCKDPLVDTSVSKMTCVKTIDLSSHTLSCQASTTQDFGLEVGTAGFSQRFAVATEYDSTSKTYTVNFDATT